MDDLSLSDDVCDPGAKCTGEVETGHRKVEDRDEVLHNPNPHGTPTVRGGS